jgi:hypothetical protein
MIVKSSGIKKYDFTKINSTNKIFTTKSGRHLSTYYSKYITPSIEKAVQNPKPYYEKEKALKRETY